MAILGQAVAAAQVRSGHQGGQNTGNINPLYVDEYGGEVEKQILKKSFMRQFVKMKPVRGTDTVTNNRIGTTELQKVTRGVRPTDSGTTFDNISIKVDTMVLARSNQHLLEDFFDTIDVRKELGQSHGDEIGKFFDESVIIQGIKAAQITNVDPEGTALGGWHTDSVVNLGNTTVPSVINRTAPEGFKGGTCVILANANDEEDPIDLEQAIQRMCQDIEEKDVDLESAVILVRPAQYYALLNNDKLINTRFSEGNGNFAQGHVLAVNGIRLQKTNRFPTGPQANGTHHFLSNAGNGHAYDPTQVDANCYALLLMPKALLGGETIPLTSKVYYSDVEIQWFVDSYLAYAVTPNRSEFAGAVFRQNPTAA